MSAAGNPVKRPAGIEWCREFPTSVSPADLADPFRSKVEAWLLAMVEGGAHVDIAATLRPAARAYLMHWCAMIASGADPAAVPPMAGVDIDWTCSSANPIVWRSQAKAMMLGYGIVYPPALVSRHTQGLAIDVTFRLADQPKTPYVFKDPDGRRHIIGPNDLEGLIKFGAAFGVIKLRADPPHWSSDGH